jgi:hypothetical protein
MIRGVSVAHFLRGTLPRVISTVVAHMRRPSLKRVYLATMSGVIIRVRPFGWTLPFATLS